jgi:hypothetical protein
VQEQYIKSMENKKQDKAVTNVQISVIYNEVPNLTTTVAEQFDLQET